jgi:hypothetical protein
MLAIRVGHADCRLPIADFFYSNWNRNWQLAIG